MENWFSAKIKPMLAMKSTPFDSEEWIYEVKWDGTRCIAFTDVKKERVRLQNRRLMEITYRYPELVEDLLLFSNSNAIFDGEIVVFKDGKPSFQLLQQREHVDSRFKIEILSKKIPAVYIVFDILYCSKWLINEPLERRRKILKDVTIGTKNCTLSEIFRGGDGIGLLLYEKTVDMGLEGVMAKKLGSEYLLGKRSGLWLKFKKKNTADCIIVGWLEGEGEREGKFGSLILSFYDKGEFVHAGQVGTGFTRDFIDWFYNKLRKIEVDRPVKIKKLPKFSRNVHWVNPVYVCEVEFLEKTKDGKLRAPVFIRLRDDKGIDECTQI
jgi:bifunctional non-homologous end joining protein LigD